ncbi:MAG: zinc-ribbon domain-containing protein [Bradyrhizobiaceae bacterium]|nr:zinc-ribbon domain-containing protein [Bradyrhizobiaceae bacterium]
MQLACPACHTAFRIDARSLGAEGRTVRCARCRTTWFARPDDLLPAPEMAAAETEAAAETVADSAPSVPLPQVVSWDDTVMVEVKDSPPLAPAAADRPAAEGAPSATVHHWTVSQRRAAHKQATVQARLLAVAVILGAIVFAGITSRANIVRMVPDLAGLYAAIGLPVNLRGVEFKDVKTAHEMHDGIPVLIIEGEIVNIARQTVEVPRLRLAVMGANGQEVYSWTTLLPHSILPAGETLPFRSRLASPPAEGKEVVVRFLNRMDLTAN